MTRFGAKELNCQVVWFGMSNYKLNPSQQQTAYRNLSCFLDFRVSQQL